MTLDQLASILEISKGLLTPLIALVAVYIAWQQWRTNQLKVTLDRYDRRFRIYEEVVQFLRIVVKNATVATNDIVNFRNATSEADFFLAPKSPNIIDEIHKRGIELHTLRAEEEANKARGLQKINASIATELKWLSSQFHPAKSMFKNYLDICG